MARFDLSDEGWAIIAPLLPPKGRGRHLKDDRLVLNGIFIFSALVHHGEIYPSATARTPRFTIAMCAGANGTFGQEYLKL